jgi:hypothetical protein
MKSDLQQANSILHSGGMKMLCLALCIASLVSLQAQDDAPAKPGFWKRAWQKSRDGAEMVWSATKNVGKKTAGTVVAPFGRKGVEEPSGTAAWRNLAMSMKLEPAQVRLSETHVIEVTVSVINKGKHAVQLEFPSSLRVEVIVKADGGKVVSRWSDDQQIEREPSLLTINPGERLEYSAKIATREMSVGGAFEIEAFFPSYEQLRTSRTVVPQR